MLTKNYGYKKEITIDDLAGNVESLTKVVGGLTETVDVLAQTVGNLALEMREGFMRLRVWQG